MQRPLVICGFPESGKTTYLAALWHLVTSRSEQTALRFESLHDGDFSHLNAIAKRWRDGKTQIRTEVASNQVVSMNLVDAASQSLCLTFPDLSGESYRQMFEDRECDPAVAKVLSDGEGMLFFIHADKIRLPHLVTTVMAQSKSLGATIPSGQHTSWDPRVSPTGIQVVELFQLLSLQPLSVPFRRVAVVLSAWDKVKDEGRAPEEFLAEKLPLLNQYLRAGADKWDWRVYGISAQGADYEKENETLTAAQATKLQRIKSVDQPSMRIKVVSADSESHDLTEPISWLIN
jgi:hypothetical protein